MECFCQKKKKNGKWKKAKWRKVATLTQPTKIAQADPDKWSGSLSIMDTSPDSILVRFDPANTQGVDMVRICYKRSAAWNNLKSNCKDRGHVWEGKNANRLGYFESNSGSVIQKNFRFLKDGKQYKFVAVAFFQGGDVGKVLSTAKATTPKISSAASVSNKSFNQKKAIKSKAIRMVPEKDIR